MSGTRLVTRVSSPASRTRARACHRITRSTIVTGTGVATGGSPLARWTRHRAVSTSVTMVTLTRTWWYTRAVMTRGSENKLYGKTYQIYTVAEKIISPPISKFKFKILILSLEILKSYYKCKFNAEFSRDIDIIWHKPTDCCLRVASIFKEIIFSCESSSRNANVCQSVNLSVSQ